jgi:uncharacterized protein YuzE
MAFYTYDEEADALYVLRVPDADAAVARTVEISDRLHVDVDDGDGVVGVEILYARLGDVDLGSLRSSFGIDLRLPFTFAA